MKIATGNFEFVRKAIRAFWCSDAYDIEPDSLRITHPSKDMNARFRVVRARGGFRFESY